MELKEEIELVTEAVAVSRKVYKKYSYGLSDFEHTTPDGDIIKLVHGFGDVVIQIQYYNDDYDKYTDLIHIEARDYINMYDKNLWTFNCMKDMEGVIYGNYYSLVNSNDQNIHQEDEKYIDSLTYNKRILTEEEYFQCSILTDCLPSSYEDALLILDTLHNIDTSNIGGVSITINTANLSRELFEEIKVLIQTKGKIDLTKE